MWKTLCGMWLACLLLAGCGGGSASTPAGTVSGQVPGTIVGPAPANTVPAPAPTQALTPPGLPAGGFPLLDAPL